MKKLKRKDVLPEECLKKLREYEAIKQRESRKLKKK